MLSTGLATAIALVTLTALCVIGGAIGFVTTQVLRLSWNLRVANSDVALAAVVNIVSAFAYSAIAMARGELDSGVKWILLAATVSVVLRHLVRLARASREE